MVQNQFSSSSNGPRNGENERGESYMSNSSNGHHQWRSPQVIAAAAASSGFPQIIERPKNWLQKNGFHSLMRPS